MQNFNENRNALDDCIKLEIMNMDIKRNVESLFHLKSILVVLDKKNRER